MRQPPNEKPPGAGGANGGGESPHCSRDEIIRAARLLVASGGIAELRGLDATMKGGRQWPSTISGYFDSPAKLADACPKIASAKGIYLTMNEVDPALLARSCNRIRAVGKEPTTSDHDIIRRRWLLVDIDAKRPAGISATNDEHEYALATARLIRESMSKRGWPMPLLADSGNGAHLLYRIDLPPEDGGLVERVLSRLAADFDDERATIDTSVHNPARIVRLYGTPACKGDSTDERPHRMALLIDVPEVLDVVADALLLDYAPELSESLKSAQATGAAGNFDLAAWIAQHLPAAEGPKPWNVSGRRWTLPVCPWNPDHTGGCAFVGQRGDGPIVAGCQHDSCSWKWPDLRERFEPASTRNGQAVKVKASAARPEPLQWKPFPTHALPPVLSNFIRAAAAALDCDESLIALPTLAVCAASIGNARTICLKRTWTEPAIVWAVAVIRSGGRKSPAHDLAMKPLRQREGEAFREHVAALEQYREDYERYEVALKAWKAPKGGCAKGEPRPPEPERPVCKRFTTADCTTEALAALLLDNPWGLLLARDELAGWVQGFDAYRGGKGGDAARWLELHRAGVLTIDRKTGEPRTIRVERAAMSVCGTIQPGTMRRCLTREHYQSGLAARLLLALPPERVKRWNDDELPTNIEDAYTAVVQGLLSLEPAVKDCGEPYPIALPLTEAGQAAWVDFYNAHAREEADAGDDDIAAAFAKLEGYAARMALVVHCVRVAAGEHLPDAVDEQSIAAGVELARWFAHETQRIYAALGGDEQDDENRRLADWIRLRGGKTTPSDVSRTLRAYPTAEDARAALQRLAEAGYGRLAYAEQRGRGRPSEVFALSDERADEYENTADATESGNIVGVGSIGTVETQTAGESSWTF